MNDLDPVLSAVAVLSLSWSATPRLQGVEPPEFDHSHAPWTEVLSKHVHGDRFDYAALKEDRTALDSYLADLHRVEPDQLESWTRAQRFAFWINAYNAHCISLVLSEYPVDSIKDIGSFFSSVWKKSFIDMPALHPSGRPRKLSLDDVEHEILRPRFEDARLHAAVNCASVSCPALRPEAYVADRLDEQLDDQVRRWLADPTRNRFDRERSRARISEIFDWFEEDFARDGGSVPGWIAEYAPPGVAEWITGPGVEVRFLDYSWKLNDLER